MKKVTIAILITILAGFLPKTAVAISENEVITKDGNVWRVLDELEVGKNYTIVFDTLGDNNIYNDEIIMIL